MRVVVAGALLALLAACGKKSLEGDAAGLVEKLGELIDEKIPDKERAAKVKVELAGVDATIAEFYRGLQQLRDDAFEINRRWDATQAEFDSHLRRMRSYRAERYKQMVAHSLAARKHATREEWTAITTELLAWHEEGS